MIESVVAIVAVVVAFILGRRKGRYEGVEDAYNKVKARMDGVTRDDLSDSDVADRLRRHGL